MTREEFKKHIRNLFYSSKTVEKYLEQAYADIDKIFDEFGEQLQDKDDEIELLKSIVEEAIRKPMGIEPHSWSDYKMLRGKQC